MSFLTLPISVGDPGSNGKWSLTWNSRSEGLCIKENELEFLMIKMQCQTPIGRVLYCILSSKQCQEHGFWKNLSSTNQFVHKWTRLQLCYSKCSSLPIHSCVETWFKGLTLLPSSVCRLALSRLSMIQVVNLPLNLLSVASRADP